MVHAGAVSCNRETLAGGTSGEHVHSFNLRKVDVPHVIVDGDVREPFLQHKTGLLVNLTYPRYLVTELRPCKFEAADTREQST
jgi:hypothetical protein